MRMLENVPTDAGVPESLPVEVLKLAQEGLFWMLKVSALPSASLAVGWKLYASPAVTDVGGDPAIVGARLAGAVVSTVIENAGNDTTAWPSLTLMRTSEKVPTAAGVPARLPVEVSKFAQEGLF